MIVQSFRRIRNRLSIGLLILFGAGAVAAGPAFADDVDDVQPFAQVKRLAQLNQVVQDMDRKSFDQAIAYYPNANGEPYSISLADYLFWKIASKFKSGARPGKIALSDFSELCNREKDEIGPGASAVCRLSIAIDLTRDGRTTTYKVRATVNTGRWFDPKRRAYKPTIRAEVRGLLDQLVGQLIIRMKRGGLPLH